MAKNLTEKQQKFLDVLFEEARGNLVTAKKLAGYSDNVTTSTIVNALQDEIAELTKKFISTTAAKAAYSLAQVIDKLKLANVQVVEDVKKEADKLMIEKIKKYEQKIRRLKNDAKDLLNYP